MHTVIFSTFFHTYTHTHTYFLDTKFAKHQRIDELTSLQTQMIKKHTIGGLYNLYNLYNLLAPKNIRKFADVRKYLTKRQVSLKLNY